MTRVFSAIIKEGAPELMQPSWPENIKAISAFCEGFGIYLHGVRASLNYTFSNNEVQHYTVTICSVHNPTYVSVLFDIRISGNQTVINSSSHQTISNTTDELYYHLMLHVAKKETQAVIKRFITIRA